MKRAPVPTGAPRPGQRSIIILFLLIVHDREHTQPRQYDLARVRDATDLGCDRAAKRIHTVLWHGIKGKWVHVAPVAPRVRSQ